MLVMRLAIVTLFSFFFFLGVQAQTTDTNAKPYIFYWGLLEAKLQWNADKSQYEAASEVSPSDFRQSMQREPRLWDGAGLLKKLQFTLEDVPVTCSDDNTNLYFQSRANLDKLAVKADNGTIYNLNLSLPDGQRGVFSIRFKVTSEDSEDKEFWQKSGLMKESVWGRPLAMLTESKEFVSYSEFNKALGDWFANLTSVPLTSDKDALISIVPPVGNPTEIKLPRNINKPEAQNRIYPRLGPDVLEPGTQVFFQVRPKDAWVGDFLHFYLVREDDPLLNRNKYDRRLFGFEWGNFRFELKGYYGNSILLKDGGLMPADAELKQEEKSLDAQQIKQLLDVELRVWEKQQALVDLEYTLSAGKTSYTFKSGTEIPAVIRSQLDTEIEQGAALVVSGFMAKGMDLRNLSLLFVPKK